MLQPDLIKLFVIPLERSSIDYIITGSVALILYAEPRLTHDIDIVVHFKMQDVKRIPILFPETEYYCPPEEILSQEIRRPGKAQLNLIHHESGFKADLFLMNTDLLHKWAFENKRRLEIDAEYSVWLAPPEYVVIRKLQYYKEGGSDKHIRDIIKMVVIMKNNLDGRFIELQASRLGVLRIWQRLRVEAFNS
jgi:hypothetical protein